MTEGTVVSSNVIKIKAAGKSDIEYILYLYEDKFGAVDEALTNEVKGSMSMDRMVLAFIEDKPVGFLWSRLSNNEDRSVDDNVVEMVIAREHYGKGIGSALLEHEREYAVQRGARLLRLTH
jgi:GNAT superfamily N-acetyltransferase